MSDDGRRAGRRLLGLGALLLLAATARAVLFVPIDGGLEIGLPPAGAGGLRATAIGAAASVGASLAVAGVLLQALLRNPLASPFILGVSAGASLGVAVSLAIGSGAAGGFALLVGFGHAGPAMLGAAAALTIVAWLGRTRGGASGWIDPLAVLLAGVVLSAVCGSLVLALEHIAPGGLRRGMLAWMTGSIDDLLAPATLVLSIASALAGLVAGLVLAPELDVLALGEDEARSVGASIGPVRGVLFVVAGGLTAVAVAVAGPIAFVGLIAPHAARGLVGAGHRWLVPAAALTGAALLVAADAAAQLVRVDGGRLPVGVFTALVGGPLFLVLLRRGRAGLAP